MPVKSVVVTRDARGIVSVLGRDTSESAGILLDELGVRCDGQTVRTVFSAGGEYDVEEQFPSIRDEAYHTGVRTIILRPKPKPDRVVRPWVVHNGILCPNCKREQFADNKFCYHCKVKFGEARELPKEDEG